MLLGKKNDEEMERLLMAHSPKLRAILDESEAQIKAGLGITAEDFWKQVDARYKKKAARKARK